MFCHPTDPRRYDTVFDACEAGEDGECCQLCEHLHIQYEGPERHSRLKGREGSSRVLVAYGVNPREYRADDCQTSALVRCR